MYLGKIFWDIQVIHSGNTCFVMGGLNMEEKTNILLSKKNKLISDKSLETHGRMERK